MYSKTGKWMSKLLLTGAMFLSLSAFSEGALQSHMKAFVVTPQADGSESFEVAKSVEPGQVIEYRTVYSNTGDSIISGLAVVGPVPPGTRYLGESASSDASMSSWRFFPSSLPIFLTPPQSSEGILIVR